MKLVIAFLCLLFYSPAFAVEGPNTVAGYPPEEALRLGAAMYLQGVLPSGKPLTGVVQGNINKSGKTVACVNCHQHSGLGTYDQWSFILPISGPKLYSPLQTMNDIPGNSMKRAMFAYPRPAYTDESLANALMHGLDPNARILNDPMPRFLLDENATKIMVFYLKNLSRELSPGVTEDEIRFATILTDDMSPSDRDALLLPMKAYINDEWNARLSVLAEKSSAVWYVKNKPVSGKTYLKASLDVWELKGPPDTWGKQLDAFYAQKPVFAILGGIAPGKWTPIHDFCEKNKIPALFPFTGLPVISEADWYTLYFSKGYYQEGEAAAKYLARVAKLPPGKKVVQVFRNSDEGNALAKGFAETWKKLGKASLTDKVVAPAEKTGPDFWKKLSTTHPNSVILIWLGPADLTGLDTLAKPGNKATLFLSSTMLAGSLNSIPDKVRDFTFLTWPTRLPNDEQYTKTIVTNWMKMKKIPVTNMTISSRVFFLTRLLSKTLMDLRGDFYRDFLLDIIDYGDEQPTSSVTYPLLSFRQGQRYASTGCYVVTVTKGEKPQVVKKSEWIIN